MCDATLSTKIDCQVLWDGFGRHRYCASFLSSHVVAPSKGGEFSFLYSALIRNCRILLSREWTTRKIHQIWMCTLFKVLSGNEGKCNQTCTLSRILLIYSIQNDSHLKKIQMNANSLVITILCYYQRGNGCLFANMEWIVEYLQTWSLASNIRAHPEFLSNRLRVCERTRCVACAMSSCAVMTTAITWRVTITKIL